MNNPCEMTPELDAILFEYAPTLHTGSGVFLYAIGAVVPNEARLHTKLKPGDYIEIDGRGDRVESEGWIRGRIAGFREESTAIDHPTEKRATFWKGRVDALTCSMCSGSGVDSRTNRTCGVCGQTGPTICYHCVSLGLEMADRPLTCGCESNIFDFTVTSFARRRGADNMFI